MVKKFLCCGVIALYSLFSIQPSAARQQSKAITLRLDDAISMALENNRDVLIARQELNKAEQQIREARSRAYPEITLNTAFTRTLQKPAFFLAIEGEVQKIEIGTNNAVQTTLSVNQVLYSGGQVSTAIRIARIYSELFTESIHQTEKNTVLQVKLQFLGILLNREILKITKRNMEQAEAHFTHVKTLHNHGAAADFDLLRAEVQVANIRPRVISAENELALQKYLLKNLIGLPLEQELDVRGELVPLYIDEPALQAAETSSYLNRSDYKNLMLTRDALDGRIKIERASHRPTIVLNYNYQFQGQSNSFKFGPTNRVHSQNATININVPIFNGYQTSARAQQAEIDVREMDYQLLKLKEAIDIQIVQARNRMDDARKRIESLAKTVEQAQKAFEIAQVRFSSGQGTQLELFDAQIAMEMAQLNSLQSVFDHESAKAAWEFAIGR